LTSGENGKKLPEPLQMRKIIEMVYYGFALESNKKTHAASGRAKEKLTKINWNPA